MKRSSERPTARKSLGQHFLTNQGIIDRIASWVDQLSESGKKQVLEIGPGPGPLTEALLAKGLRVTALEIDERMLEHLREKFSEQIAKGQLELIQGDANRVALEPLRSKGAWVVCGNLPYNVGTGIVFRMLEDFPEATHFCYMLQKEVVLRFTSGPGEQGYGIPGIKLRWCTRDLGRFWVKAGSFTPPPKVESGVFAFERLPPSEALANPAERGGAYDKASRFLEKVFQHRRKMLRAGIRALADTPWGSRRPEELKAEELFKLSQEFA
jgi:16S rRNA (adenine1518-N6/adenine1519-N6)-dimethyltransferase